MKQKGQNLAQSAYKFMVAGKNNQSWLMTAQKKKIKKDFIYKADSTLEREASDLVRKQIDSVILPL